MVYRPVTSLQELVCQNDTQRAKGFDLGAGPPRLKLFRVPLPPTRMHLVLATLLIRFNVN